MGEPKVSKNGEDKAKPAKKEPVEAGTFEKPALRKATPVKRELEEAKLEKVILKAHAFEKDPQDTPGEMPAKVKVGKPLKVLTSDETEKKKDTAVVKKKKKKQPLEKTIQPEENNDVPEAEPVDFMEADKPIKEPDIAPESVAVEPPPEKVEHPKEPKEAKKSVDK